MESTPQSTAPIDLATAARQAVRDYGFLTELPADAARQLAGLAPTQPPAVGPTRDLRSELWSSIDDQSSRDLDQLEVADAQDGGGTRVQIAIADVDALVPRGSPLDLFAAQNATTVYTGVSTFPMLPELLSTDRTSLSQDNDRRAIIIEFSVASDGTVGGSDVYSGSVRNRAKLAYDPVGAWLSGRGPAPSLVSSNPALAAQLRLQFNTAEHLRQRRIQRGALEFQTIQATPVVTDGRVTDLHATAPGPARDLIEEFMVAANTSLAAFITRNQRSSIRRVVRTPARWPRIVELAHGLGTALPATADGPALAAFLVARQVADPDHFADLSLSVIKLLGAGEYVVEAPGAPPTPHFGLAVDDYTHGTAPNRRYADLITQRIVKAIIAGTPPPYSDAELTTIAAHCTAQEDNARRAARLVSKQAAALLLAPHVGTEYDAIVTGVNAQGTYARLMAPPVEGRVTAGAAQFDVGDRIRVRLTGTDAVRGYIDLAAIGKQLTATATATATATDESRK